MFWYVMNETVLRLIGFSRKGDNEVMRFELEFREITNKG